MRSSDDTEVLSGQSLPHVITDKLNSGQSGFYRTIYSGSLKEKLAQSLADGSLSSSDSIGLITDASEAAKAGYYSSAEVLELMYSARHSTSEQLVGTVLGELSEMRTVLSDIFDAQKALTMEIIRPNLERLGTAMNKNDTVDDQLLRPSILGSASYAGDASVTAWAVNAFDDAVTPEDIRPDVRGVVYQTAVREHNDAKTHAKLLEWYRSNTIPGERTALAGALAGFKAPELSEKTLALITSDQVKLQDSLYWIAYSLRNRWNKQLAWQWVQDNWDWVAQNFGKEKEIDYYLRFCASGFATDEHLRSYTEFFERVNIYGSKRAFEQGKETIQWQTAWKKRDTKPVSTRLETFTF
jgi:aminopeptidase 2